MESGIKPLELSLSVHSTLILKKFIKR